MGLSTFFVIVSVPGQEARAFEEARGGAVIGTFELQPRVEGARRESPSANLAPPLRANDTGAKSSDEKHPQHIFDDALDDLQAGERASAQRLFELLIAEAPNSELAARARWHLAKLYAEVGAPSASQSGQQVGSRAIPPGTGPNNRPTINRQWVSADIELAFITDAGDRVFFSTGSADLGARARTVILQQARWLKARYDFLITVDGFADDAPLDVAQQRALALARAEAVRQRLVEEGVDAARIDVRAFGPDQRIADCGQPQCYAQNRRVVTRLAIVQDRDISSSAPQPPYPRPVASETGSQRTN